MTKSYWHTTKFGYPNDSKHNAPAEIAVLDVDGDGDVDVFVSEGYQPFPLPMHVLINDGKGHFADKTKSVLGSIPTGMHPREIVVDDFNNDGRPDLFVADHGYDHDPWPGAQNKLFLSSGAHGFVDATSSLPPASDFSHSAASADIDGDKDIDIYVGDYGGNPINPFLLINDGSGSFTRSSDRLPIQVATQEAGFTTEVFLDADGDGDADLFLGGAASSSRIYLNPGNGDFSSATLIDVPQGPFPVANMIALDAKALDINGDGALDLVVTQVKDYEQHYVQILINDGTGHFADETPMRLPPAHLDGAAVAYTNIADINGDGYMDLCSEQGVEPPFLMNDGTGHFVRMPKSYFPIDFSKDPNQQLHILDANGDGRQDALVTLNNSPDELHFKVYIREKTPKHQVGSAKADGLLGDARKETISGLKGNDVIFAAGGKDKADGGGGKDYVNGGDGRDKLLGAAGKDTLVGGLDADKLGGGGGHDKFQFNATTESTVAHRDTILDFHKDKIDLHNIDADTGTAGNQAFAFIGGDSFAAHAGAAGLVRFSGGVVEADVNGDGVADLAIKVKGVGHMSAGDFIL